jgi:hypothetical protein
MAVLNEVYRLRATAAKAAPVQHLCTECGDKADMQTPRGWMCHDCAKDHGRHS